MAEMAPSSFRQLLSMIRGDDAVKIPLGRKGDVFALVDKADAPLLLCYPWKLQNGYAVTGRQQEADMPWPTTSRHERGY